MWGIGAVAEHLAYGMIGPSGLIPSFVPLCIVLYRRYRLICLVAGFKYGRLPVLTSVGHPSPRFPRSSRTKPND